MNHINSLDLALLISIFELFALFWIGLLGVNNMVQGILWQKAVFGFVVGILTTIPALLIFNYTPMKIRYNKTTITHISLPSFAFANGVFLATLFTIESLLTYVKNLHILLNVAVGFTVALLALLLLIIIYNHQPFKLRFDGKSILSLSLSIAFFVAIIEALILPQLVFFSTVSNNVVWLALSGSIAGFVGAYVGTRIYFLKLLRLPMLFFQSSP